MHENLYATVEQIIPVLLLALMWDSAYLDRLSTQQRGRRSAGSGQSPTARTSRGQYFWTKQRVRLFILTLATLAMAALLTAALVLAGAVPDSVGTRAFAIAGLTIMILTMLFRIWVDVINATAEAPAPEEHPPGTPGALDEAVDIRADPSAADTVVPGP